MNMKNLELTNSIVLDVLCSIVRLVNNDFFIDERPISKGNQKEHEKMMLWIENTLENISKERLDFMKNFFSTSFNPGGSLVKFVIKNKLSTFDDFISRFEETSIYELFNIFLNEKDTCYVEEMISIEETKKLMEDKNKIFQFINNQVSISPEHKWLLMQLFNEPQKAKADFLEFFNWYYTNIFIALEKDIKVYLASYHERLSAELKNCDESFIRKLVKAEPFEKLHMKKLNIGLSYFLEKGFYENIWEEYNEEFIVIGCEYLENVLNETSPILDAYKLFKALADETRLNILRLLSERPWYGIEIAEKLGLSNSTISHHLNVLSFTGVVTMERINNRFYFTLNKELLVETLNKAVNKIFR